MKATTKPTSKDFLWRADVIVKNQANPVIDPLYDIWFDYFIWSKRSDFEGGVVCLLGRFPDKTSILLDSYADVSIIDGLVNLKTIPQSYVVLLDYESQAYTRHHFFNEISRHFKKCRTPPQILVLGRYNGETTPAGHVLTIVPDGTDSVEVILEPSLSKSFKIIDSSISMAPAALSKHAPYSMFGCNIQFTAIG